MVDASSDVVDFEVDFEGCGGALVGVLAFAGDSGDRFLEGIACCPGLAGILL